MNDVTASRENTKTTNSLLHFLHSPVLVIVTENTHSEVYTQRRKTRLNVFV